MSTVTSRELLNILGGTVTPLKQTHTCVQLVQKNMEENENNAS